MEKLTKQQEDIVCKLLDSSYSEEITQFILDVIEEHNWTRSILGSDSSYLTEEQKELYYKSFLMSRFFKKISLAGGKSF